MQRYFFVTDFDKTIGQTFKPPNFSNQSGVDVESATQQAVANVLGEDAKAIYNASGGLRNRTPYEVVSELLQHDTEGIYTQNAYRFFLQEQQEHTLTKLVPENKGFPLAWDEHDPTGVITELVVRSKLSLYLPQIKREGKALWPEPYDGFLQFLRIINRINRTKPDIYISLGILSSGHETFIRQAFAVWSQIYPDIHLPDILVTEDDIRGRTAFPRSIRNTAKPGWFPLFLSLKKWRDSIRGEDMYDVFVEDAKLRRQRVVYFGDDLIKDGELASRNGFIFGWFKEEANQGENRDTPGRFIFHDWNNLARRLQRHIPDLQEGRSLGRVFLPRFNKRSPEGSMSGFSNETAETL